MNELDADGEAIDNEDGGHGKRNVFNQDGSQMFKVNQNGIVNSSNDPNRG